MCVWFIYIPYHKLCKIKIGYVSLELISFLAPFSPSSKNYFSDLTQLGFRAHYATRYVMYVQQNKAADKRAQFKEI